MQGEFCGNGGLKECGGGLIRVIAVIYFVLFAGGVFRFSLIAARSG